MLSSLPPEVALDIFGLLELKHLVRCLRVCREWYDFLINMPWLWTRLNLVSSCGAELEPYEYALINYITWAGVHLRSLGLDFELSEAFGTLALQLVASNGCRHLERLELNNSTGPEERPVLLRAIRDMGPAPSMSYLQLYCLEMSLDELYASVFVNFPRLRYLDLSDSNIYDDEKPIPKKPVPTAIQVLILSHIEDSSSSVFDFILGSCPKLERLYCFSSDPSYDVIKHISKYHRSLDGLGFGFVRHDGNRNDDGIIPPDDSPLRLSTSLQSASLDRISDEALTGLLAYGSCTTLSSLKLSASAISDVCFRRLAAVSRWPNLRHLALDMVSDITELGLFSFLQACTQLECLSLKRIPSLVITDRTLDLFGQLDSLIDISYGQPDRITPAAVRRLVGKKYVVLNNRNNGVATELRLAFNTHTRVSIHFPTQVSVDALLHMG